MTSENPLEDIQAAVEKILVYTFSGESPAAPAQPGHWKANFARLKKTCRLTGDSAAGPTDPEYLIAMMESIQTKELRLVPKRERAEEANAVMKKASERLDAEQRRLANPDGLKSSLPVRLSAASSSQSRYDSWEPGKIPN